MDFTYEELEIIHSALIEKSNRLFEEQRNMNAKGRWKANWSNGLQGKISDLTQKIYHKMLDK